MPLEKLLDANAYVLAFDATSGIATGVPINNVATQVVNTFR